MMEQIINYCFAVIAFAVIAICVLVIWGMLQRRKYDKEKDS